MEMDPPDWLGDKILDSFVAPMQIDTNYKNQIIKRNNFHLGREERLTIKIMFTYNGYGD